MLYIRPLKKYYNVPFDIANKGMPCSHLNPVSREVSCDAQDMVEKCDCFLFRVVKNIRCFVKHQK